MTSKTEKTHPDFDGHQQISLVSMTPKEKLAYLSKHILLVNDMRKKAVKKK